MSNPWPYVKPVGWKPPRRRKQDRGPVVRPLSEKARERWLWQNPDPQVWEAYGTHYMQVTFPPGHKLEGVWRATGKSYEEALDRFIMGANISRVPQEMLTCTST